MHQYFPHTDEDLRQMLDACGAEKLDDLYSDVPAECRLKGDYRLPESMSEKEVRDYFESLGKKNRRLVCFAGAGYYDHYAPAVIADLLRRSEFLTAYTPYQPEISQGTLQYIFEYQSMMTELTGLDVSNASMYDGSTATAEAAMMAVAAARRKNRVFLSSTLDRAVAKVVSTYCRYHRIELTEIPATEAGCADLEFVKGELAKGDVAGVIVAQPNRFGIVEDFTGWADAVHAAKALLIMNCNPSALAVLRTPAEWGADIAVGDGRSLGMPLNYGGPSLGFMCVTKALIRKMPGRIVGATTDAKGQRSFVLTLQAREQHIRREKATSNICSNQGLMTLYAVVYLGLMGPDGLKRVNAIGCDGAHYLAKELEATGKLTMVYPTSPYLNEFEMRTAPGVDLDALMGRCLEDDILMGVKTGDDTVLLAVTEMQTKADIDRLVNIVKNF